MREAAELKPRGVGEQLDLGFNLYFRNFVAFAKTAAIVVVPISVISIALTLLALGADPSDDPGAVQWGDRQTSVHYGYYNAAVVIGALLQVFALLVVTGAVMKSVADAYRGEKVDAGESIKAGARRLHSLIWINLLIVLALAVMGLIGILFFPLFLAIIYFYVAWSLAVPVLMVEGVKGTKALGRSLTLIDKSWWRSFGVYLVGFLVYGFVYFLGTLGAEALGGSFDSFELYRVVSDVILAVLEIATAPFLATLFAVVYFDNRVRKDGLDIEAMAGSLDEEDPAPAQA